MPIYEFVCPNCKNRFEKLVSFSETNPPICPVCKSNNVQRQLGIPAIHFKGSGWYINDSKETNTNGAKVAPKEGQGEEAVKDKSNNDDKSAGSDGNGEATQSKSSSGSNGATTSTKKTASKTTSKEAD